MALNNNTKLYAALGLLAALGGAYYFQHTAKKQERAAYSAEAQRAELPKLAVTEEQAATITRIELSLPASDAEGEGSGAERNVLVKEGETWRLVEPVAYLANQKNVESLLKNLPKLAVKERIAPGTGSYAAYELTDEKALRIKLLAGEKAVLELAVGKSGGRGQTARVAGRDGVYALDGFSKFLYERRSKAWRDLAVVSVEKETTSRIEIVNETGKFVFTKAADSWKAKQHKGKAPVGVDLPEFDPAKVEDLLRAYKSVNATGFGDDKRPEDVGLAEPRASVSFFSEDGKEKKVLFGDSAEGTARWAKLPDAAQIYSLSSWVADWATAEATKFQKKKDDEKSDDAEPPGGMPMMGMPGMQGMPGMGE